MEQQVDRHLPYDIEIEQALLGALIVDNELIDLAGQILQPEHFFDPVHQRLFEMIVYLATEGDVTPLVIHAAMKTDPGLTELKGHAYLAGLAQAAPAMPNVRDYARIVRDLAARRALIRVGEDLVNAAYEAPHAFKTADIADQAMESVTAVVSEGGIGRSKKPVRAADAIYQLMRKIEAQATADKPLGTKCGIKKLDEIMGGFFPGKLIVAGGRPGMGKSILLTNICRGLAMHGAPSDYDSGEMNPDEVSARLGCDVDFDRCWEERVAPLQYREFVQMTATGGMFERMHHAMGMLHEWAPIDIVHMPGTTMTLERIETAARRKAQREPGFRLLGIDHLQLVGIADGRKSANRNEIQTVITGRLKALAEELGWCILALSQLARKVEEREDKHPRMDDFREGGSIEQDADVVIGIYRPLRYAQEAIRQARGEEERTKAIGAYDLAKGVLELAVLKNRSGPEADYFPVFIDEKASAIRGDNPGSDEAADLLNWDKIQQNMDKSKGDSA